jgi:uncharacterized protein (TIGR02145 family)
MKRIISLLILLVSVLFSFQNSVKAEGSKEIYIGTHNTWLMMCSDNVGHCNNGGDRTPFATYGCSDNNRLYFTTLSNAETVFMGFNGSVYTVPNPPAHTWIVFEIRNISGTIIYPEMKLPRSGTGFIQNISQARVGPTQIYGAGGYTGIDFHPSTPGNFYIEFALRDTITNNIFNGGISINLIDITVQDTVASIVKPGRLNSKSWQFYETNTTHCSATTYVYSIDSIITSCQFNDMQGGIWVQFCNQWGCQNTGNFVIDRKSTNTQSLLPEYKIFINNPDITLYPPATTLGQVVPPQPYGIQDCNTGHIAYYVNVDKPGSVEIDLTFGGPYITRVLNQTVVSGTNTLTWDGLDGTVPTGVPVPNGINVTFTVKYINGLTNLPFYDVEGNPNGFIVSLVNPPGSAPLVFWDDSNVGGGTNFTGCSSPPGCHTWNNPWGNIKTINSWWYNVSSTTTPVNIIQFRHAGTLTFVQTPQTLCAGTNGHLFSVNTDINTEVYHWSYTGTGATIHQINPSDYFVTVDFALNATSGSLQVYGTNSNCLAPGPTSSLAITINPVPVLNPPSPNTICAGVTTNITLTSVPASTIFNWMSPPPTCSPNIIACPPGQAGSNLIHDVLNLTNSSSGTVVYHIISTLNGCSSTAQDFTLTVLPAPVPVISGNASVCVGSTGVIYSTLAGMTGYTWTISGGGTITAGMGTNSITVTWNTAGAQTVFVGYTDANSCTSLNPSVYNVTVNPLPVPTIAGSNSVCVGSTGNVYTTLPGMTNYQWNISAGGTITSGGSITDNTVTVTWNTPGPQTVSLNYTDANTCTALAPTVYPVTVNPLPIPVISGATGMCLNTTGTYTTTAGMTGYLWAVSAGGIITSGSGTNSITIQWIANGTQTITLNYTDANGCTAATPSTFNVTINTLPVPSLYGLASVCTGSTTTYTSDLGMNNYSWIVSAGGTTTAGGGPNDAFVTVLWSTVGGQTVSVNYVNGTVCTAATPTVKDVTVHALPTPSVSGTAVLCAGTSGVVYSSQPGMTNYIWVVSVGGAITSGGGPANNTATVTWNTSGAQTVSVNFNDANGCTALAPTVYPVTVNPLPVPALVGPASVCLNSTGTYITDAGMTNYLWSVSAGGTITSGTGTNSINILWSTIGAKTITVNYHDANGCTAATPSSLSVNVSILPVPALNGLNTTCSGSSIVYTTDAGMTNYSWLVSAGGTITAGGGTADNSVTVTWNTVGAQTVSVNYTMGTGCTATNPTVLNVNVKPRPAVTNAANSTICSGITTSIPLLASLPATTFTWTATGSSGNVSGFSNSGGPVISQTLVNSGFNVETVDYAVTPSLNGCDGTIAHYIVTVDPVADAYFNPNGQTLCSGGTTSISILSHVAGATFTWTAIGSSGNISGFGPGATSSIAQTLTNTGTAPGIVTYTIFPSFNNCPGTPNSVVVTVNPLPGVTYTPCNDVITTTAAQPFRLKGGLPLGGTYSGTGVNTGIFYPSIAGMGNQTITYSYSNTWGCAANATQVISVINPAVFLCDNSMTDIRDNQPYLTVKIGTQCWMAENLNYGNFIPHTQMQRDNCISEKYCFNDIPANCTSYGGLYQWDELMQYDNVAAAQGFCPPGWHVPTENEWNTLFNSYISNGFAGAPLKYTGYSGFNAFLSGTRFNNVNWNFSNFAVMFWSSTTEGNDKAWAHGMNTFNPSVSYYPSSRTHAFNVRCIKD